VIDDNLVSLLSLSFACSLLQMSQGAVTAVPLTNGNGSESHFGSSKESLLEKLAPLQDLLVSGRHLSLEDFSSFIRDASRISTASATLSPPAVRSGASSGAQKVGLLQSTTSLTSGSNTGSFAPPPLDVLSAFAAVNSTQAFPKQDSSHPTATALNQILTEASHDLAEAEESFRRQDLHQMQPMNAQPSNEEPVPPYLDVAKILAEAQQIVPHYSAFNPPEASSKEVSDSFDENSLYSSQGWSPPGANGDSGSRAHSNGSDFMDISDEGEVYEPSHTVPALVNDAYNSDQVFYGNDVAVDAEEEYEPYLLNQPPHTAHDTDVLEYADDEGDDYSPPPPDTYPDTAPQSANVSNQFRPPVPPPGSRTTFPKRAKAMAYQRMSQDDQAKPGPSATSRSRRGADTRDRASGWQKRHGQDESRQNLQVSKKRRNVAERDPTNRSAGKRRAIPSANGSPEPYIKPEPLSPPPFSLEATSRGSRKVRRVALDDVEIISPQVRRRRSDHQSGYESAYDENGSSSNDYTTVDLRSPTGIRRSQRDDQDLRRVASLQHASRSRTEDSSTYRTGAFPRVLPGKVVISKVFGLPFAYFVTQTAHPTNWATLGETVVDGKLVPVVRLVDDIIPSPRKVLFVDQHGNKYYDKPPPKKPALISTSSRQPIFIDDDGNQYYQPPSEAAVLQPPISFTRRIEPESYYPRSATQQSGYAQSLRPVDAYEAVEDHRRMPPPQARPPTYPNAEVRVEARQRAFSMHPLQAAPSRDREAIVPPTQQYDPARPATSMRDVAYNQRNTSEFIPRSYSVRPEPSVRQDAMTYQPSAPAPNQPVAVSVPQPEYVARAYSVRPETTSSRGVAAHPPVQDQRIRYIQQVTPAVSAQTQPSRAYSVMPQYQPRNTALDELRTRYDPAPEPTYRTSVGTPSSMHQHGRTFSGNNGTGTSNVYGGRDSGGYGYH